MKSKDVCSLKERLWQTSVQFSCSVMADSLWPHERQQASLPITNSQSLLRFMSIESVMPCNHLILCHPLFLLPSIFPSTRVCSSSSVLRIRWPKYWSFSFIISPSNKYSGLISLRIDWLDLLAVQGTLKNLLLSSFLEEYDASGGAATAQSWRDRTKAYKYRDGRPEQLKETGSFMA